MYHVFPLCLYTVQFVFKGLIKKRSSMDMRCFVKLYQEKRILNVPREIASHVGKYVCIVAIYDCCTAD